MSHGLQILTHYTYSKTLGQRGITGQGTQDISYNYPQSVIRSYGEETYSHRHRFLFQTTYEPRYEQRLPGYLRPALGDWHIRQSRPSSRAMLCRLSMEPGTRRTILLRTTGWETSIW